MQALGARKPSILLGYLDDLDHKLGRFLPSMLLGLSEGPGADDGVRLVRAWLKERKHVAAIMRYLRFAKPVDPELLDEAMAAALETEDDAALLDAVHAANVHHGDVAGGLITKMLMPAIEQLGCRGKTWWVDEMWFLTRQGTLFSDLTGDQADAMLAANGIDNWRPTVAKSTASPPSSSARSRSHPSIVTHASQSALLAFAKSSNRSNPSLLMRSSAAG